VSTKDFLSDSEALAKIVDIFEHMKPESRARLFQTLGTYLDVGRTAESPQAARPTGEAVSDFTEDRSLSAKEFLFQKQPRTDVERVACLAYYLTHYQNTTHFKTVDISRLNTDAAQIKFSNPAVAVDNASKYGFIAQAGKGFKQITALGEQFVAALPDRDAAQAVLVTYRRRRSKRKPRS
jgi:hypothetical protein